jgi:hypothetical protein
MDTANNSINTSYNLVKNIKTERLEKNIESIIEGSLPYYKSIFKQILLSNLSNAEIYCITFYWQNKMKRM